MTSSGTTLFQPSIADLVIECFARLQVRGPALTVEHIIDARRTLNIILQDWSGNRNVNLWKVSLDYVPLVPGKANYTLTPDLIQLLDIYLRQVTIGTTATSIGNALVAVVSQAGVPVVSQVGEPIVAQPGSGVFTTTAGNSLITMNWPLHGLSPGIAFQFQNPTVAGGVQLQSLNFVESVIDINTLTFFSPTVPVLTGSGSGGTPLFATTSGSPTVTVILPRHGLAAGGTFNVALSTTVGGVTLLGNYTVATVPNGYSFTITAAANATSSTAGFENGGRIAIFKQNLAVDPIDLILYGISRTEYASIPDKVSVGRPTTFWFERVITPTLHLWEVPPPGSVYGLGIYSMRQIQDANPVGGQTLDLPNRMFPALCAELTAFLAEKYKPEAFAAKLQLAQAMWKGAASEDRELVPLFITPGLSGYFR